MKIGIQFAMPGEFQALPGVQDLAPFETVSTVPFYRLAPDVVGCVGGVGKVNAAMAAEILCLKYGVEAVVSAGVAGCTGDLPVGALVVPTEFVQHDVDTTAVGDPIGLVSTVNCVSFPTWQPERLASYLTSLGHHAYIGRVATGDWFATRGARSEWIRDTFAPLLVEMEGCAVAQVCLRSGVRFTALKAVSDHLFSQDQAQEYSSYGRALEAMGRAVLPFVKKIQEAC